MTATADTASLPQPELRREWVDIDRIKHHPDNKRKGDVVRIERSLRDHGQIRPLLVQVGTDFALVGNHTLKAARNIGKPQVMVDWIECDEDEALELLLVDNATSDAAEYDERGLAELLARMAQSDRGVERTGYSEQEAQELARITGLLAEQAGDFLGDMVPDQPYSRFNDPSHVGAEGREYHQLNWPVTAGQRDVILKALKTRRDQMPDVSEGERPTTVDALVQLAEDFLEDQSA